jgi:hypothetical protein
MLWRAYRAALWGAHEFRAFDYATLDDSLEISAFFQALDNAIFASARA